MTGPAGADNSVRQSEFQFMPETTLVSFQDGRWGSLPVTTHRGRLHLLRDLLPRFERQPFRLAKADGTATPTNPAHQAIVRADSRLPVGVVSRGYQLIQHQDLYDEILKAFGQFTVDARQLESTLSLTENGERMELGILFPQGEQFSFQVREGDAMRFQIKCYNSVDGSARLMLVAGWLRFVCQNGLVTGRSMVNVRERHTGRLDISRIASSLSRSSTADSFAERGKQSR
jgi:hypothetical protein